MSAMLDATQILDAHRYFAIECNNKAWDLVERADPIASRDELLNHAHASAFHWQAIGTDLQKMRATMLLANVHASLGLGGSAMNYANQMRSYFLAQSSVADWEIAFVHTIHARASACVGDTAGHKDSYANAQNALAAIVEPEDKAIVMLTFEQIPKPV